MRTKLYFMTLLVICVCSCSYYVPDDFPKAEFYSYVPYEKNQVIYFTSDGTSECYVVSDIYENYIRGSLNRKSGKESVTKYATFSKQNSEEAFILSIDCIDRATFRVSLHTRELPRIINATYEIDYYTNEDPWAISFNETKIFREFLDEITLQQDDKPTAKVKKGQGLLWFVDAEGRTWTAE